ncbi:thioredoxin family protein [Dyadobacter aurulentus]|uniref:thioredoxin family protein n=1 Tax=Dyadobacter sp. UC 10 TaxID=2605428 RepID=UPI0011F285A0|nr:DUF255 domain-containing protein [Dyadobacter sp. UC 10]KAA0990798.1 DUF255 domain-containing protein [Dyadobacter sp. UC 10]
MKNFIPRIFIFLAVTLALTGFRSDSVTRSEDQIHWLTIEEAFEKVKKEPKKVMIDLYTDWCGWCKVMDRETFKNKAVVAYVNAKYYAVKLDAEQRKTIVLGDKKFEFLPQGAKGINQIALALTNNQPSFPTTVFLDDQFNMIQPLAGYLKPKEFHEVITFFGEDFYKKEDFENYKAKTYKEKYRTK